MQRRSGYWCNGDIQHLSQAASRFAIIPGRSSREMPGATAMKWVLPLVRGLFARLKGIPNNTNRLLIRAMEEYALDPTDRHRKRYFQELLGSFLAVPTAEP